MSDEQINIAIAEACGWNDVQRPNNEFGRRAYGWMRTEHGNRTLETQIPNYCNDLNAMHGAEETLDLQKAGVFAEQLRVTVYRTTRLPHVDSGSFAHVHATARDRAEAFLRTIGKWEGGK
jgi:hypothetical protein